jgi:RHS repeat-associated protein
LATPFGFNGKRLAESIYDYGARWYDPQMGRFLQPDPVVADPYDPQGLSRYAYVRNDPVGRVDPTGMWSLGVNAFAGQVDHFGFTGLIAGFGLRSGGSFAAAGGAMVGGIPVAQLAFAVDVLGAVGAAVKTGAFQFFSRVGTVFRRASLPDVAAGPPPAPGWRTPGNLAVLDSLDPYVANLAAGHLSQMSGEGLEFRLTEGFRSYARQNHIHLQGRGGAPGRWVTKSRGGQSLHNFGLAYDIAIFDRGKYIEDGDDERYRRAGELGERVTDGIGAAPLLEWGGRWNPSDASHLQFDGGLPLSVLRERYESGKPKF